VEIGRFRGGDGVGLEIRGWRWVGLGIGRWEELDLDPTTGCCKLQRDASLALAAI
jgi:hypothetical protein